LFKFYKKYFLNKDVDFLNCCCLLLDNYFARYGIAKTNQPHQVNTLAQICYSVTVGLVPVHLFY
jgi:hypothetical protein